MPSNKDHSHWQKLIDILNEHFKGCPTRLGVFEREDAVVTDYWIESGLPFFSLSLDVRGELPSLQIDMGNYSHNVGNILRIAIKLSASGEEDGLDILDGSGRNTVLRFEPPTS
jgi:hypothetical protein